jgi:hypothetical protein
MSGLKGRINKLYAGSISDVTCKILVTKNESIVKQNIIGNNQQKVIEIVVRL